MVEAFGTNRADFAIVNTFAYMLLKETKKYPVEAMLKILRGNNEGAYKGQILVRADSGINSIKDITGKKMVYVDPSSTSGYVLPSLLLKKHGVKPRQVVFAQRHDSVITMLYQKQADAGATYYQPPENGKIKDAREKVLTQFPDVEKKIKILSFTQEIPNAPLIIRTNLYKNPQRYQNVKKWVSEALLAFVNTPEGKSHMKELYSITGLTPTNDSDYQEIMETFKEANTNLEDLIGK